MSDCLIDVNELAHRLGTTERHIRRLVFERRIPYVKVGRLVRFEPRAIERWLDEQRRHADTLTFPSRARARLRTVPSQEPRHGLH